jgi:DNA repair protein RadC
MKITRNSKNPSSFKLSGEATLPELFEAVRELSLTYATTKPNLTSPQLVKSYLHARLAHLEHEEFHGLFLDTQNNLIHHESLFTGTIDSCAVHPREVAKLALSLNAASLIFAHNHPSGYPEPSPADRAITERLKSALALIDCRVLDHIVIGEGTSVSLAERGWI